MLADSWDPVTMNPTNWLMSEKYDGIRAQWNGTHFVGRDGKLIEPPLEYAKLLPNIPLDGELW